MLKIQSWDLESRPDFPGDQEIHKTVYGKEAGCENSAEAASHSFKWPANEQTTNFLNRLSVFCDARALLFCLKSPG